jgi:hypothetical protein
MPPPSRYMVAELLELSGNAARDHRCTSILPRHLELAINGDGEFRCMMPSRWVGSIVMRYDAEQVGGLYSDNETSQ